MKNSVVFKLIMLLVVSIGVLGLGRMYGKILTVTSVNRFDRTVLKKPFCAVLFYYGPKGRTPMDSPIFNDPNVSVQRMMNLFTSISQSRAYQYADMQFLRVNVADKQGQQLARACSVDQVPTLLLFRRGRLMRTSDTDQPQQLPLSESTTYKQIRSFINQHLRDDIQTYIDRKNEYRRSNRVQSTVYFGYGYPAYAPYYYPPAPTVGFGVSL